LILPVKITRLGLLAPSKMQIQAIWLDWASLAVRALGEYLRYVVLPYPLKAFHMLPVHLADTVGITAASLAGLGIVAALLLYLRHRVKDGLLWFVLFVVMLIPVFYFKG